MRCTVKKTFEAVVSSGNDAVVRVKSNQPGLLVVAQRIAGGVGTTLTHDSFQTRHGRMELREVTVFDAPPDAFGEGWHGLIQTVVEVFRRTTWQDRNGNWHQRDETALYLSTCPLTADEAAVTIRGHWGIENKANYVRDVTMGEDASRIRHKPGIAARIRSFALNILRKNGETNISQALFDNALSLDRVLGMGGVR